MKRKATNRNKPAKPDFSNIRIWKARNAHNFLMGFLVTEPGNVDRPLAMIFSNMNDWEREAYQVARWCLSDPSNAWRETGDNVNGIDLRPFGKPDSQRPDADVHLFAQVLPNGTRHEMQ